MESHELSGVISQALATLLSSHFTNSLTSALSSIGGGMYDIGSGIKGLAAAGQELAGAASTAAAAYARWVDHIVWRDEQEGS